MNIYEQLNRISANESLSEKYVVRSTKELRKLHEDYDEDEDEVDYAEFIPEEMTPFFCIDYEDDENPDEYMPSKGYKDYKAVASLRAYGTYADALCDNGHGYALLINDPTDDFFVGYVVGDRLYKLTYEDILNELGIDNEYDDQLTGEDLRVAISEELPFVIDELGSRDNIDDIVDGMTDHLDESGFDYDAEEVRKIVVELTALNEDLLSEAVKVQHSEYFCGLSVDEQLDVTTKATDMIKMLTTPVFESRRFRPVKTQDATLTKLSNQDLMLFCKASGYTVLKIKDSDERDSFIAYITKDYVRM